MREYDRTRPLIALHVPNTAGTTARRVFKVWFGRKLYRHYYGGGKKKMPRTVRLRKFFSEQYRHDLCIYGHFDTRNGTGVEAYYPEADQFVSVLREPFENAVSNYFHRRRLIENSKDTHKRPMPELGKHLQRVTPSMLNHFPFQLTIDNYKELIEAHFIHIGISEELQTSLGIIAAKLNKPVPSRIEVLNRFERPQQIPYELKPYFIQKFPLEHAIYDYACEMTRASSVRTESTLGSLGKGG